MSDNQSIVKDFIDACNANDLEQVMTFFSEDCVLNQFLWLELFVAGEVCESGHGRSSFRDGVSLGGEWIRRGVSVFQLGRHPRQLNVQAIVRVVGARGQVRKAPC